MAYEIKILILIIFLACCSTASYAAFAIFQTKLNPKGKLLAVDGISFILQTDGISKICRAGGC